MRNSVLVGVGLPSWVVLILDLEARKKKITKEELVRRVIGEWLGGLGEQQTKEERERFEALFQQELNIKERAGTC